MSYYQDFINITQFSLDQLDNTTELQNYFKKIKLDKSAFFQDLYVTRRLPEDELENSILKYQKPIIVYGFPGVGKTSLVLKVLYYLDKEKKKNIICFYFDFGNRQVLTKSKIEETKFNINKWLDIELRRQIKSYILNLNISNGDIVKYLFQKINKDFIFNPIFQDNLSELHSEYKDEEMDNDFESWFFEGIDNKVESIMKKYRNLQSSLTITDYLYYLSTFQNNNIVILFYDNTDSIHEIELRQNFYKYMNLQCGLYGNYSKIIVTSRIYNIFPSDVPDQGSHNYQRIRVDYREFIDIIKFDEEKRKVIKIKNLCNEIDEFQIKLRIEQENMKIYAEDILRKRIKFIDNINKKDNEKNTVDILYSEILKNKHIYVALFSLANYNRRNMFKYLGYFIKYLINDLEVKNLDSYGYTEEEISFNIESLFYHWVFECEEIHSNVYDYVLDTKKWYSDKNNSEENNFGCSFVHLLLVLIYKLSGSERYSYSYKYKTKIKNIIKKLKEIGYNSEGDEDFVKNKIFDIIKCQEDYLGFVETSKFLKLKDPNDLDDNVEIWLTPRACYILEFLSLKFLFLLALCRKNEIKTSEGKIFNYDDRNALSQHNIKFIIEFLVKMAIMHIEAMIKIKDALYPLKKENWYNYYKRWFCINTLNNNQVDGDGDLLLLNIITSHIKFLNHQKKYKDYNEIINEALVNKFKKLKIIYKNIIKDLITNNNINSIRENINDLNSIIN